MIEVTEKLYPRVIATDVIPQADSEMNYVVCVLRADQIDLIAEAVVQRLRQDAGQGMQVKGDYKP